MAAEWRLDDLEAIEEAETLRILIQDTESSLLAFALYRGVSEREAAVRLLKERLKLPIKEFALSAGQKNPIGFLQSLPNDERACVFIYDIEEALPEVTGYVNFQREAFSEVPHAIVFWVREHGLRQLAEHAPDFWAWRSGVFDFRVDQPVPSSSSVQHALGEALVFQDQGDLDRRVSLYEGLFREYSQIETPDERFLAGLQLRLGVIYHDLAQFERAEAATRDALVRSQRAGIRSMEAQALQLLGILAQERWQLDEAEEQYRRSLAIEEQTGNDVGIAANYHQLGRIAEERQQFDQAEGWYLKGLEIYERLGLEQYAAFDYHQLGRIAEAEHWYHKALEIRERLGLEQYAASDYHQLGMIAQRRQQFDQAEGWYRKALEIKKRLGLERHVASDYHQLGMIAQERQQFDQAERWYRKALEILERLGHPPLLAESLAQMGVLRRRQERLSEAVAWLGRALMITAEYRMRVGEQILWHLASVMQEMGEAAFVEAWREAFDGQEPPLEAIRHFNSDS